VSADGFSKGNRFMKFGIVGLVAFFIAAYVTTIALYARSGGGDPHQMTEGQPAADGTTVTIDVEELLSDKDALNANVAVSPGPELLDPLTHGLKEDFKIRIHSVVTPTIRSWSKGMVPGLFPVPLTIAGDPSTWPFDRYRSGPITVDLFRGAAQVPERATVTFVDRLAGWRVAVSNVDYFAQAFPRGFPVASNAGTPAPYRVELHRSPSTVAVGVVIVGVFIALAGVSLFVAVQTARDRRKFQPPMTTWYAAMLFAVMPLRSALPDAPPIGSWIDVTVVLWVIVVLVISMLLYIYCWWRHLRPDVDKPT
jgi:hypothetical protein